MLKISSVKIDSLREGCITDTRPVISFSLESDRQNESLKTAEITAGGWKSITGDQTGNLYGGEMRPFTAYPVHISATGESGDTAEASAVFETGRLDIPWQASWITNRSYDFPQKKSPVPMTFRKSFPLHRSVRQARIYATALGIYDLYLNGCRVGDDYFSPGFTSYEHQIQYQVYDITGMLAENNLLTAVVAGGWAAGSFNYNRKSKISADRQALLCELRLEYTDGKVEILGSDETWEVTLGGPYRAAEWYDGERYDARIDLEKAVWKRVDRTRPRKSPKLLVQYGCPIRVQEELTPVSFSVSPGGEIIYDFGQNFAGVISAEIEGADGQKILFRHAEVLINGELFLKSLRTAKAEAEYICKEGSQAYSPRLTYMGFRYVGVRGIQPEKLKLKAWVLHSDFEETGSFCCSNELINRLQSNIRWGGKSNFMDIPTDCPQRDERQGWTGDFAVFASTACYNFDLGQFISKWLLDMRSEQGRGGGLPMVIPRAGDAWPAMANSCWGDSCVLVPWAEYLARGDKNLLKKQYPTIKKFLKAAQWWSEFLAFTPNGRHIWQFPFHFGDWCAPGETIKAWLRKGKWVGTAYFANSCGIAAQMANLLGKPDDEVYFRNLRAEIIRAYRKVFTNGGGKLKKEFQTAYVLPLYFGMTEGKETKTMAGNLARLVREAGNHLTTGFTGTPYLLFALSDNGYADAAYDLLLQESCPSWLYEVKAGGTTIWERWDALRPDGTVNIGDLTGNKPEEESNGGMVSFNHYANGAVGDWLYRRVAGIESTGGGYKTFRIAPVPGGNITWAKGTVITPYGSVVSDWVIQDGCFSLHAEVPVSAHCTLILPNGEKHLLGSGKYDFSCDL